MGLRDIALTRRRFGVQGDCPFGGVADYTEQLYTTKASTEIVVGRLTGHCRLWRFQHLRVAFPP